MEGDPNINKEGFPIELEYGKFTFIRQLDAGGAGIVALYRSNPPNNGQKSPFPEEVAVKFDPGQETNNLTETLWLKEITARIDRENLSIKMPKYYLHSFYKGRRFFVMTYLPHSIDDLLMSKGPEMKDLMIAEVATKMLVAVQQFHELGFLHRDIKPSNFRVKDGEVYITDFGTHKSYKEQNGEHIQECFYGFFGTIEYASIRTHQSLNQSRKDDLETLGYSILDLIASPGEIDFLNVDREAMGNPIKPEIQLKQARDKYSFIFKKDDLPQRFHKIREYLQAVQQLDFTQEPNYEQLKSILNDVLGIKGKIVQDFLVKFIPKVQQTLKQRCLQVINNQALLFRKIKKLALQKATQIVIKRAIDLLMIDGIEKVNAKLSQKVTEQKRIIHKKEKELLDARNELEEAKSKISKQQEDPECPLLPKKAQQMNQYLLPKNSESALTTEEEEEKQIQPQLTTQQKGVTASYKKSDNVMQIQDEAQSSPINQQLESLIKDQQKMLQELKNQDKKIEEQRQETTQLKTLIKQLQKEFIGKLEIMEEKKEQYQKKQDKFNYFFAAIGIATFIALGVIIYNTSRK